jgi:hypothetical protein
LLDLSKVRACLEATLQGLQCLDATSQMSVALTTGLTKDCPNEYKYNDGSETSTAPFSGGTSGE